ncbi:hypothetical protein AWB66_06277 [Caballeronia telluris]|uniref:Uncharacterized protein n=1 Tax=Caballeronia telluris TaxID=326475 RepID=A0A158KHQ8_9BURK|nr:hypothetical protein AWB66_06277 [Caballeronia telluris]
MDRYFTTRQGAIKRLMEISRDIAGIAYSPITVTGRRRDGSEVSGIDRVLLNVRAGRVSCFVHSGAAEEQLVFIS